MYETFLARDRHREARVISHMPNMQYVEVMAVTQWPRI
jgi:hypothetical protein